LAYETLRKGRWEIAANIFFDREPVVGSPVGHA